jgi:hypothetical protein
VLDGQASTRTALAKQTSVTIGGVLTYQACDDRPLLRRRDGAAVVDGGLKPIVTEATGSACDEIAGPRRLTS